MKTNNVIVDKSFNFSLEIISLYKILIERKEFIISKQLLRSATSIGANVEEAVAAQSRKDFIHKCQSLQKKRGKQNIGLGFWNKVNWWRLITLPH